MAASKCIEQKANFLAVINEFLEKDLSLKAIWNSMAFKSSAKWK